MTVPAEATVPARRSSAGPRLSQGVARWVTFACALLSVATTFGIVVTLFTQAAPFFARVPVLDFLTGREWRPTNTPPAFGVLPLVGGTLLVTVGAGLVAIPLGLLAAVYLAEYATPRVRGILKPGLELLAGVPTVVYGYLGLTLVTPLLRNLPLLGGIQAQNALTGAIVVGIMILPLVSSLCEDAISAVPRALREGAYGLGATRAETIRGIVLPSALSGIMASFILALSRALGETMAVTLAAGATARLTLDPRLSVETMTAYIVTTASGDAARGSVKYEAIFAVGAALFVVTLAMNLLAQSLVRRFRRVG